MFSDQLNVINTYLTEIKQETINSPDHTTFTTAFATECPQSTVVHDQPYLDTIFQDVSHIVRHLIHVRSTIVKMLIFIEVPSCVAPTRVPHKTPSIVTYQTAE